MYLCIQGTLDDEREGVEDQIRELKDVKAQEKQLLDKLNEKLKRMEQVYLYYFFLSLCSISLSLYQNGKIDHNKNNSQLELNHF
jgi:hypothetical protein